MGDQLPLPNPLHVLHAQTDAETQPYGSLEIVSTFGEPQAEYAAIRKGAALMDLPHRGLLELTGKDRLPFLDNLITNQCWNRQSKSGLAAGAGIYSFLLNVKGRIVTDMTVLEFADRTLLDMDSRLIEPIRGVLDKYIFSEQVKVVSQLGRLHRLAIHGPEALSILTDAARSPLMEIAPLSSAELSLFGIPVTVFRSDECAVPGLHLVVPIDHAPALWTQLMTQFASPLELGKRRLRPVGWAAYNACRIEAGTPLFDVDFGNSADPDQSTLPAETGPLFPRAVSVTKGCYLGQEIVARMYARQQVAKKLVGIRIAGEALPVAGAPLMDDAGNAVGMVTSSTMSPMLSDAPIALAYLKKPFFNADATVNVPAEGALRKATVVDLPFIIDNSGRPIDKGER